MRVFEREWGVYGAYYHHKKGVCKNVGHLESNEEFGSQEGRAGTPLLVITISPITPSSVCLIPSSTMGEPSCSFMAQRCHVVRIIFQFHCSDWWPHLGMVREVVKYMWVWSSGEEENIKRFLSFNKRKKVSLNLGCRESQLLRMRGSISL